MKVLAIDSSSLVASVAVVEEEELLVEYTLNYKKTHSQTLLPMLDEIKRRIDLDLDSLDAIALTGGPGSFTGLRIGSATAKGLGQALEKPLVSVPTTEALAYNLFGCADYICPIMDARRNQVYTGIYYFHEDQLETAYMQCAIGIQELVDKINELGKPVIFLGDGVPVHRQYLEQNLTCPLRFAPAHMNRQRAGALGRLAIEYVRKGKVQTAMEHKPDYLRLSQAERERMEKENTCKSEK